MDAEVCAVYQEHVSPLQNTRHVSMVNYVAMKIARHMQKASSDGAEKYMQANTLFTKCPLCALGLRRAASVKALGGRPSGTLDS